MKIMKIMKIHIMSKKKVRDLLMKTIDIYMERKSQINQDLNGRKRKNIKEIIYLKIMKCFEICLLLSKKASPAKYIELTYIIISNIIENYNEYSSIKIHIDPSKIRKIIEKIKKNNEGQTFENN